MKRFVASLLVTSIIAGCSLVPNYERPVVETPASWKEATVAENTPRLAFDWWKSFTSDELNVLMAEGLNNNLDLKASEARIKQARASLTVARASLLPTVDATAGVTKNNNLRGETQGNNNNDTNLTAGLNVNYELDLFGANRAGAEASSATLLSTKYQRDALALVVMGDISTTYFNLVNARERLKIADGNLNNAREILRIVQARYDAGAASGLELAQQKSTLGSFEASRASTAQEISTYENALAILLGKPPLSLTVEKADMSGLTVPAIAPVQPADLITRRPDIASAEADLLAANANIGAARAAFFPSLTIGGGLAAAANPISAPITLGTSLASSALAPIFSGGSILGNLRLTEARKEELVDTYRKTVLVAFQEVEDALAAEKASAARETAYKTAVQEAQKAYDLSLLSYKSGSVDFQTVINAQNTLLQTQQNYSLSLNERLTASVSLFKAMGGGWQSADAAKVPTQTR